MGVALPDGGQPTPFVPRRCEAYFGGPGTDTSDRFGAASSGSPNSAQGR